MTRRRGSAKEPPDPEAIEVQAIGELKANGSHLLVLGNDGKCHEYDVVAGELALLEPDDAWAVDVIENASIRMKPDRA